MKQTADSKFRQGNWILAWFFVSWFGGRGFALGWMRIFFVRVFFRSRLFRGLDLYWGLFWRGGERANKMGKTDRVRGKTNGWDEMYSVSCLLYYTLLSSTTVSYHNLSTRHKIFPLIPTFQRLKHGPKIIYPPTQPARYWYFDIYIDICMCNLIWYTYTYTCTEIEMEMELSRIMRWDEMRWDW